jgi:hypothetical protein
LATEANSTIIAEKGCKIGHCELSYTKIVMTMIYCKVVVEITGMGYSAFARYFQPSLIEGIWEQTYRGYGAGSPQFCIKYQELCTYTISDLDFVHGSEEELISGKACVVRNRLVGYREKERFSGLIDDPTKDRFNVDSIRVKDVMSYSIVNQKDLSFKTIKVKEGRLLFIGQTANGNSKIKLFRD